MFVLVKHAKKYITSAHIRAWTGVIIAEIIIIVLGVYIADGLHSLRDRAQRQARIELIVDGLRRDIGPFIDDSAKVIAEIRARHDAWLARYAAGERPLPLVIPATMRLSRPHETLWSAMLDSGGIDLIPVQLLSEIADFYDRHDRLVERYLHLSTLAQEAILPFLDQDIAHFYADGSKTLRPIFEIYQLELAAIIEYAEQTVELGRAIQLAVVDGHI
jgi:hypothetical protein